MTTPKYTTLEVKLLGQKIVLRSSEADPEILRQVIQLATLKLSEAENRARGSVPHQIALLAVLDLAEDYIKLKKRVSEFKFFESKVSEPKVQGLQEDFLTQ